ncbi:MAG: hypothetical protein WC979_01485 [Candidatus Pacearchaeota archaeon]|jgi:NADH:ubiquinone oxidoreductase subunit|nr:hypothetical protein [Clostridia bacterium]
MEENYSDLFNLGASDFAEPTKSGKGEIERYKPDAKSGKDNVYKSVVRFLPWHADPKKSIMSKWTAWLVDPISGDGKYVDCPSTVGKKSLLQDIYWKLRKSESVAEQELAKSFSRRQTFASLVQIIKDDNQPDLVGKILVFPYGIKIHNKIMAQIKPEFGKPHIPFDLFEGRPFLISISLISGYNNYDNCTFLDEKLPFSINGESMEKTPANLQKIVEYLKENTPDLGKYDFREWDEETIEFVNTVIKNTVPKGKIIEGLQTGNAKAASNAPAGKSNISIGEPKTVAAPAAPKATPAPAPAPSIPDVNETEDFNIDDINFDDNMADEDLYDKL